MCSGLFNDTQRNVTLKQWYSANPDDMIPIILYQSDYLFFISGFLKMHASMSLTTLLLLISIERSFACYYLNDYEKKSRIWIAVSLLSIGFVLNFIITVTFYFNLLSLPLLILLVIAPNIIGFNLIFYTRYWNQKVTETHEKFANHSNYTLAARFQAKENIKSFQMVRKVIIAGMGMVALGIVTAILLLWNIFPLLDNFFNLIIQGEMSFTHLIVSMTIIYSVDSFRKVRLVDWESIWIKFKISRRKVAIIAVRKDSTVKTDMIKKETETYFNQLANSWT
ncbi:hypothetical protein B9Z55_006719 [Caenorhabditis nigoni]|uniref:7TM GPCR serpentine receptor class x (Srx) domain-containing protein n=2 Tax=Caenorhabditis nigoni TaxID=1611254 RepID=A0A2G5V6P7_9PELO|nr:hypothetical protein B9Z55_006719 [Caenorhabditis nigoni]